MGDAFFDLNVKYIMTTFEKCNEWNVFSQNIAFEHFIIEIDILTFY